MSLRPIVMCVCAAALLTACAGGRESEPAGASPWRLVAEVAYHPADGAWLTPETQLAEGSGGFALFVETDGCAQVLVDGPAALAATRVSDLALEGLVVFDPEAPGTGAATIRLQRLNCSTMSRLSLNSQQAPGRARIWRRALPTDPGGLLQLPVSFQHSQFSTFVDAPRTAALVAAVNKLLAATQLEVVLTRSESRPDLPVELSWFEGAPERLMPLLPILGPPGQPTISVVFAGCLERVHPETGSATLLEGLVPRVPGVGAVGAAIYLRNRPCAGGTQSPIDWPLETMATRVTHELGHYLGLFHVEEADGELDDLADTIDGTIMARRPTLDGPHFTPLQTRRMRTHALLLNAPLPGR